MQEELPKKRGIALGDRILVGIASGFALALVYLLFFQDIHDVARNTEPLGVITTPGTVRRRHARSLQWKNISGEASLYLHDIVYTPADTTAEVVFGKNKKLTLQPDSMVQFDEVTLDAIFITLFDGEVKGEKTEVVVRRELSAAKATPSPTKHPKPATPVPTPTAVPLDHSKMKLPGYPSGLAPLPSLNEDDTTLKLSQQELNKKLANSRKEPKIEPLKKIGKEKELDQLADYQVTLVRPIDAAYNMRANRWLKMEWREVPLDSVRYVLEISETPQFHRFVSHNTDKLTLSVQLDQATTYYWRVKALRRGATIVSKVGKFSMSKNGGLGNARDSRIITSEVKGYVGDVATDGNFEKVIASRVVKARRCSTTGLKSGRYFCRIRSISQPKVLGTYEFEVP